MAHLQTSLFLLLLFCSSPSWSAVLLGTGGHSVGLCHSVWGTSSGQIVEPSILYSIASSKIGQTFRGRWILESADSANFNHLKFRGPRQLFCSVSYTSGYSCNPPNEINPDTGICGKPDIDEGWCDSDEYNEELFAYEQRCAAEDPNHYTSVEQSCTDSNNYNFKCVQGSERPDDNPDDGDNPDCSGQVKLATVL